MIDINKKYLDEDGNLQPLILNYYNKQKKKKKLYLSELQRKNEVDNPNLLNFFFSIFFT